MIVLKLCDIYFLTSAIIHFSIDHFMNVKFVAGIPKVGHVVSSLTFYISKYSSFQGDNLQSLSLSLSLGCIGVRMCLVPPIQLGLTTPSLQEMFW
jgi:hypothetical protein